MIDNADSQIDELVALLRVAYSVYLFTGAGISTGSGIPDFRGPNGVWKRRQPVYYRDFMSSESARIEHWDYKLEGWAAFRDARPNSTHDACFALEKAQKLAMVVTQNIDGLHSRAGTSVEKLVELHGTNSAIECQSCERRLEPDPVFEEFRSSREPPRCECGGWLKPATISFGQNLREEDLRRAEEGARRADLVVSLGSSLSVTPAAGFPLLAAAGGAPYVIVNQGNTDHDGRREVSLRIEGDVGRVFQDAVKRAMAS
ncbi:MAG: NAD-dependent deacetylase [Candidatus Binatia bacterium]|jgi:NAD-dependent deacetylase